MNNTIDIKRVCLDDNVAYGYVFDPSKKEIIISFDWYFDRISNKDINNPVNLIINNWSKILFSKELQKSEYEETFEEVENVMSIYELLQIEFRQDYLFLHVVAEDNNKEDIYGYYKFYNATISFELVDMTKKSNIFTDVKEIEEFSEGTFYVAHIPPVKNNKQLLQLIITFIHLPQNTICNWNNISDVISYPYWLPKRNNLAIVHEDISLLSASEWRQYFNVIEECRLRSVHVYFIFNNKDISTFSRIKGTRTEVNL